MAVVVCGMLEFATYWDAWYATRRFSGLTFEFTDGTLTKIQAEVERDEGTADRESRGAWKCILYPSNVTSSGIENDEEAARAKEFANVFFGFLRTEVRYRFATVGVEVAGTRSFEEVLSEMREGSPSWPGLVVSNDLWEAGGRPDRFVPFSPTHRWAPWFFEDFR